MKNIKFEGIMPAIITPFNEDNKTINVQAAKDIIDWQLGQGADGFYVLGATGEGVLMGREEREIMCETAVKHVAGRKPIICHIASINFLEAVELAKKYADESAPVFINGILASVVKEKKLNGDS